VFQPTADVVAQATPHARDQQPSASACRLFAGSDISDPVDMARCWVRSSVQPAGLFAGRSRHVPWMRVDRSDNAASSGIDEVKWY
jgi:hypothetical protein